MGPNSELPIDQSPVPQFNLRTVLSVTAAVAVVCAIAVPWIRAWSAIKKTLLEGNAVGKWHTMHLWTGQSIVDLSVPANLRDAVDRILVERVEQAKSR
jgi:hypothetical protein